MSNGPPYLQSELLEGVTQGSSNLQAGFPEHLRLLVVEDVPEDVQLIALSLQDVRLSFQLSVADSYAQCRTLLAQQCFEAILADYRLPGLRVRDLQQLVKELQPDIPFILVTGSLMEEAAVECIKAGMTDYVLKDSLYRLPTVLKRALNEAELKRQQQAAIAQIRQQAWRETTLNRITQAIRETLVLEEILKTTVEQLKSALEVDRCLIVENGPGQSALIQFISSTPEEEQTLRHQSCSICQKLAQDIQTEKYIELQDSDETLPPEIRRWLAVYQVHSALLVALSYQRHHFGTLVLNHIHRAHPWSQVEASLVTAVAEQCAIAIYQAKLYEQAQSELAQRRRAEDQLRHDAFHDALTGLPNRALFLDRLNHAIQIAHRRGDTAAAPLRRRFAVLFLDLDDFRIINDSLGHNAGDFLLRIVADRLRDCLHAGDTLARTSGDEFAILLEDIAGIDGVIQVVERFQAALNQPVSLETHEISVCACIGIVIPSADYSNASQYLRDADTAMYQAKAKGRGSYQVFDGSMHVQVKQRLQLENALRRALVEKEFALVYQPIVYLPNQQLCGFEALIRWNDPTGLAAPEEFIPTAEKTGLILPMGEWVLSEACRQWKAWMVRWPGKMQRFRISVNLSAKQFAQPSLIDQIDAILQVNQISGHLLRLEVTESALIEHEAIALNTLQQLRSRRIQVLLDDFGTGYSSLSYLMRFPKDGIKIDKSFVSNLESSTENQEIVKTIISLGSNLGLDVVGEGIETKDQAAFLLAQGCLLGQGYHFSSPLPAREAEAWLQRCLG